MRLVYDCFDQSPFFPCDVESAMKSDSAAQNDSALMYTKLYPKSTQNNNNGNDGTNKDELNKYYSNLANPNASVANSLFANYGVFCSGRGGPSKLLSGGGKFVEKIRPFYKVQGSNDKTLIFESRFEEGNLRRAVQVYVFFCGL